MKLGKYLMIGLMALTLAACDDTPQGESTKKPTGTGSETPSTPETPGDQSDVVSPTPSFNVTTQKLTLDASKTYQEMEGFGASDCWLGNVIGQYWGTTRSQIAQWLFSQKFNTAGEPQGIGLSVWRVNLGAGSAEQGSASGIAAVNNRAEAYLGTDGKYNWNKCAGQRYFMEQARNNGVEKFVLFSNSPLVQYTKNGKGTSNAGSRANLKDDCYDAYAEYMAEVAKYFSDQGYRISHISPVNEPQFDWNGDSQEGSGWQNEEIARLVRALDASLESRGLSTGISVGEGASWDALYEGDRSRRNTIDVFFNPTSAHYVGDLKHVDNICGHSYWTYDNWMDMRNVRAKLKKAADAKGVKVWQTEWSLLGDAPSELGNYDNVSEFDLAQYMSRVIHNDIVVGGVTSWQYWTAMSVERYSQKSRFELIKTTPTGGEYSDDFTTGGKAVATDNLWVLGNYSLFVRPGYKRIDISYSENKNFFISAYIAPDNSKLVLVVTNYDKQNGVKLDVPAPEGVKAIDTYTTTKLKHLQRARFNPADQVFVDPASVTTVVYSL